MICSKTTFINRYGLKTLNNDELNIINIHELSSNEMKNNSVLTKGKELYKKIFCVGYFTRNNRLPFNIAGNLVTLEPYFIPLVKVFLVDSCKL